MFNSLETMIFLAKQQQHKFDFKFEGKLGGGAIQLIGTLGLV